MDCGFARLLFVELLCFMASCVHGLTVFEKKSGKWKCMDSDKTCPEYIEKSSRILPKLVQNPSKIEQKRSQIDQNGSLDRFRRQIAPRSAQGTTKPEGAIDCGSFFGQKGRPKGRFRDPLKIENRSKNAFSRLDGHLDPPKMLFGRGFGKTWKFDEKSTRKWKVFDGSEPRLALYSSLISHFRHFWKKNRKIDAKREAKNHCRRRAFTAAPQRHRPFASKTFECETPAEIGDAGA